ncbi:MAG: GlcNAc-transferase family protein [Pseudohongiellaceae bacterium]
MPEHTPSLFVQIASYRDTECQWTVKDLFEKAAFPDRITVGICWQYDPARDRACFVQPSPRPKQTRVIAVSLEETDGVCWARAKTQELFEDQDYVLMIDSHMRFIHGWDSALIEELSRCNSAKPFLSTYPPSYVPPHELQKDCPAIVLRAKPFTEYGDIRFDGEVLPLQPERPLRGAFLAAGLLFAAGRFVREVPYDPFMYFDNEEVTLAARAFTYGWDVYSPTRPLVYHYYYTKEEPMRRALHWDDHRDWEVLRDLSRERYAYLLCREEPGNPYALTNIEHYGLGSARSLEEFEYFCGIDFRKRQASEKALHSGFINGLDRYRVAGATK